MLPAYHIWRKLQTTGFRPRDDAEDAEDEIIWEGILFRDGLWVETGDSPGQYVLGVKSERKWIFDADDDGSSCGWKITNKALVANYQELTKILFDGLRGME